MATYGKESGKIKTGYQIPVGSSWEHLKATIDDATRSKTYNSKYFLTSSPLATPNDIAENLSMPGEPIDRLFPGVKSALILNNILPGDFVSVRKTLWEAVSSKYSTHVAQNTATDVCLGVHFGAEWFERSSDLESGTKTAGDPRVYIGLFSFDLVKAASIALFRILDESPANTVIELDTEDPNNQKYVLHNKRVSDTTSTTTVAEAARVLGLFENSLEDALSALTVSANGGGFDFQKNCQGLAKEVSVYGDNIADCIDIVKQYNNLKLSINTIRLSQGSNKMLVADKTSGLMYFYEDRILQALSTFDQIYANSLNDNTVWNMWGIRHSILKDMMG